MNSKNNYNGENVNQRKVQAFITDNETLTASYHLPRRYQK
jgi:hypothetical protein